MILKSISATSASFCGCGLGAVRLTLPPRWPGTRPWCWPKKGGERRLSRILETEPNPRVDRDGVSPDYPLASRLIGLRGGDEVGTKALGIDSITYVVTTIQNKHVHARFRSLELFEAMFPESRAFGSFKIDPTKGEESFKPIFDAVKRRGEFARQIEDMYRSGQLPLAIGAKLGGSNGL